MSRELSQLELFLFEKGSKQQSHHNSSFNLKVKNSGAPDRAQSFLLFYLTRVLRGKVWIAWKSLWALHRSRLELGLIEWNRIKFALAYTWNALKLVTQLTVIQSCSSSFMFSFYRTSIDSIKISASSLVAGINFPPGSFSLVFVNNLHRQKVDEWWWWWWWRKIIKSGEWWRRATLSITLKFMNFLPLDDGENGSESIFWRRRQMFALHKVLPINRRLCHNADYSLNRFKRRRIGISSASSWRSV